MHSAGREDEEQELRQHLREREEKEARQRLEENYLELIKRLTNETREPTPEEHPEDEAVSPENKRHLLRALWNFNEELAIWAKVDTGFWDEENKATLDDPKWDTLTSDILQVFYCPGIWDPKAASVILRSLVVFVRLVRIAHAGVAAGDERFSLIVETVVRAKLRENTERLAIVWAAEEESLLDEMWGKHASD